MSKILLINPLWSKRKDNVWDKISAITPPVGLAYIASFLEKYNYEVDIFDMNALNIPVEKLSENIKFKTYDYIGITCTTPLISATREILKILNVEKKTDAKIILGGVHPTVLPGECLNIEGVDIVVRGEGEKTILEILESKDLSKIQGVSYVDADGEIIHTEDRPTLRDLDILPMPAYEKLPMELYRPALGAFKKLPGIGLITSRGCPGKCTFCHNQFGKIVSYHSAQYIFENIKLLYEKYGFREFSFYDDTFTANKKRVAELCRIILDSKLKISWCCFARVDFVDQEILLLMKKAGCHQIMYGFESANEEILKNINKKTNLPKAVEAVKWTKKAKIDVRAAFMLGNPGETEETLEQTYKFAVKINPELLILNITTPFPGTAMFKWAKENGYLTTEDWKHYDLAHNIMRLPTISQERIQEIYSSMFRRFYFRPTYLFFQIKRMTSLLLIKVIFKAAYDVFLLNLFNKSKTTNKI